MLTSVQCSQRLEVVSDPPKLESYMMLQPDVAAGKGIQVPHKSSKYPLLRTEQSPHLSSLFSVLCLPKSYKTRRA